MTALAAALYAAVLSAPPIPAALVASGTSTAGATSTVSCLAPKGNEGVFGVGVAPGSASSPGQTPLIAAASPTALFRQSLLQSAAPHAGPREGGSLVQLSGLGFQSPLRCLFIQDAQNNTMNASVASLHSAACYSPPGSVSANVLVTWADGCALSFSFYYYVSPAVLLVSPPAGPRFGVTLLSVYASNLFYANSLAPQLQLQVGETADSGSESDSDSDSDSDFPAGAAVPAAARRLRRSSGAVRSAVRGPQ